MDKDILDMFNLIINKIDGMEQRMGGMEQRMGGMENKIDGMEQRMGGMENKIDGMERRMGGIEDKVDGIEQKLDSVEGHESSAEYPRGRMERLIAESETRIMVYIENNVGKRLDAMMDGYKTNYEQNNETAQRVDVVEDKVDTLQDRVAVLENAG